MSNLVPLADPEFRACLRAAASNAEIVAQFDRLNGTDLARRGTQIQLAVDDATGRTQAALAAFVLFVHECVWTRLPGGGAANEDGQR